MNIRQRIIDAVDRSGQEMFALLSEIICIQSGSRNKAGVDRMARRIASALDGGGMACRIIPQSGCGDHVVARTAAWRPDGRQVLITGHMDTVFPADTAFNAYREDAERSYGPGVIDMKGGLVAGIFALKALEAAGALGDIPLTFVFNADEEIGSPYSRDLIEAEARSGAFAFVLEAGGLNGEIVTGRKGSFSIRIHVAGQAGHAAMAPPDKGSAILALARQTIAIEALNAPERGITVNVGRFEGGIGYNTVPGAATAEVDFRFLTEQDAVALGSAVAAIVGKPQAPNTRARFEILSSRPPMPETPEHRRLFETVAAVGRELGVPVKPEFRFGVSDANLIAAEGTPVIDGLGPVGSRDHSEDEYMIRSSLPARTRLLACAIRECWSRWQKGRLF
jgi:glutamate carboxypeptidase